ncbi:MAG: 4Fe-4S dicluster domain-containing protein [Gammaproteobacteria bacterium]|nr:4Fe-4S dicluster domain-containing protein [Gammaproteobacteria bacterium]
MLAGQPISRPKRWDNPFDSDLTDEDLARILELPLFNQMDLGRFPAHLPLTGIVRNDMRIGVCERGDILVREGDYGNSAFLVLEGSVAVILPPGLSDQARGNTVPDKLGWLEAARHYFQRARYPEVRPPGGKFNTQGTALRGKDSKTLVYLKDPDAIKRLHRVVILQAGELFGEVAALARTPLNSTIFAEEPVKVLEIRWQGLRDLRRYVESFRQQIDGLYRERNLVTHLKEINLFSHLSDTQLQKVAQSTLFESYGNFDWHTEFNIGRTNSQQNMAMEHVIAEQGSYPDGLLFIRSGFAVVAHKINNGKKTISVASNGDIFGLEELLHNSESDKEIPYQNELGALGYADVLRVPTLIVEEYVLPYLSNVRKRALRDNLKQFQNTKLITKPSNYSDFMEFSVDHRYINGTATMLIDSDRCTRCDECVHACANSHGGNPRFVRHGKQHEHYIVANACMHCVDPVCMIGCPTGAIHRSQRNGEVVINDASCIGCATCANSCPYDNIRMVEVRDVKGDVLVDDSSQAPIMKATKCDLCFNLPGGPACERACPHDALKRVDMADSEALMKWLNR